MVSGALMLALAMSAAEDKRGLYGWGLGLEVPLIGVLTGLGDESDAGAGFTFGGAVDYELTPSVTVRGFGQYSETFAGRAEAEFNFDNSRQRAPFDAEYFAVAFGLGLTYAFWGERRWAPYVGVDGGAVFGGFDYNFGEDEQGLRAVEEGNINDNAQWTWMTAVRGGMQFDLASWLQSSVELSVSYVPLGVESISNTVEIREVTGLEEALLLVRANFIARFGL